MNKSLIWYVQIPHFRFDTFSASLIRIVYHDDGNASRVMLFKRGDNLIIHFGKVTEKFIMSSSYE